MTPKEHEVFSKRRSLLDTAKKAVEALSSEMKDIEVSVVQHDNKIEAQERVILAKKAEIADLDEKIRQRNVEAMSSHLAIRDELDKRHQEEIEREGRIRAREQALTEKEQKVSVLLDK